MAERDRGRKRTGARLTPGDQRDLDVLRQLLALPPEALAAFGPEPLPQTVRSFVRRRASRGLLQALLVEVLAALRQKPTDD